MAQDHYVAFKSEESIAQLAYRLRDAHVLRSEPSFNIVDFVEHTLPKQLKKGPPKIELYDRDFKEDVPAYVSFNPPTLNVDSGIWTGARIDEAYPRFVIAHEVGHLALHDHTAKAFSRDKSAQIRFADNGQSAEWQANIFAGHLLLPTSVVERIDDLVELAFQGQVPVEVALERLLTVRKETIRKNRVFEGDFCNKCGNFSLKRVGLLLRCEICPNVLSAL
jgi:IrrE N-terminal-like domain